MVSDEKDCLRGPALQKAIDEDRANGLIPFYVRIAKTFSFSHFFSFVSHFILIFSHVSSHFFAALLSLLSQNVHSPVCLWLSTFPVHQIQCANKLLIRTAFPAYSRL